MHARSYFYGCNAYLVEIADFATRVFKSKLWMLLLSSSAPPELVRLDIRICIYNRPAFRRTTTIALAPFSKTAMT